VLVSILFLAVSSIGCAPVENHSRKHSDERKLVVVESVVTTTARSAFAARDRDYADQLNSLADRVSAGEVRFDSKLSQEIDKCREHAAKTSGDALAQVMASEFGTNALQNPQKAARSLRDLAAAVSPNPKTESNDK
jgi:hypothetical protein